jgi:hypothetical protein
MDISPNQPNRASVRLPHDLPFLLQQHYEVPKLPEPL